ALEGPPLKAYGSCHLKHWGLDVCAAVLYLPEGKAVHLAGEDVLDPSVPKQLELRYLRGISADKFRWTTRWAISRNGFLTAPVEAALKQFNPLYKDVIRGDCYTLSYHPDSGHSDQGCVTLQLNGVQLGTVEGRLFSE
ncbi:unnamed protein product, partial [Polarella glacialis]